MNRSFVSLVATFFITLGSFGSACMAATGDASDAGLDSLLGDILKESNTSSASTPAKTPSTSPATKSPTTTQTVTPVSKTTTPPVLNSAPPAPVVSRSPSRSNESVASTQTDYLSHAKKLPKTGTEEWLILLASLFLAYGIFAYNKRSLAIWR